MIRTESNVKGGSTRTIVLITRKGNPEKALQSSSGSSCTHDESQVKSTKFSRNHCCSTGAHRAVHTGPPSVLLVQDVQLVATPVTTEELLEVQKDVYCTKMTRTVGVPHNLLR